MFENNLWTMEPVGRPENTIQGDKIPFHLADSLPDPNGNTGKTANSKTVLPRSYGTVNLSR